MHDDAHVRDTLGRVHLDSGGGRLADDVRRDRQLQREFRGLPRAFPNGDPRASGITQYSWDFGDGSSGSGPTPAHVYAAGGTYAVKLTATDAVGLKATIQHDVVIATHVTCQDATADVAHNSPKPLVLACATTGVLTYTIVSPPSHGTLSAPGADGHSVHAGPRLRRLRPVHLPRR